MLRIFCLTSLCILLTACGKNQSKLPQICQDLPDVIETLTVKAETNPYVSAASAKKVKLFNERKLKNSRIILAKTSGDPDTDIKLRTRYCDLNVTLSRSVINKLDNAKTKEEAEKILAPILSY